MDASQKQVLSTDRFSVFEISDWEGTPLPQSKMVIRHPGAVAIIPVLNDGRICLIRNFRIAVGRELIELPAGTREENEPSQETAARELLEETGYRARTLQPLTTLLMSPGILDERIDLFVATELHLETPAREPGEQIENLVVTFQEATEMIRRGEIQDSKTISGLLYYGTYVA